jgi:hypothetical protein
LTVRRRKRLLLFGFPLVVLVIGYYTGLLDKALNTAMVTLTDTMWRRPFDSTAWKNDKHTVDNNAVRVWMVHDLLEGYPLAGMTRKQIADLLGRPQNCYSGGNNRSKIAPELRWTTPDRPVGEYDYYSLGPEPGFLRLDGESLIIEYDRYDRVISASIIIDD